MQHVNHRASDRVRELEAENERLKTELSDTTALAFKNGQGWLKAVAEIGRLRVALERAEKHLALSAEQSHPQAEIHALVSELRAALGRTLSLVMRN